MQKIGIVGLGYVGLPLAVEFGKHYLVVGFDINTHRIDRLKKGFDDTLEVTSEDLNSAKSLSFTSEIEHLETCSIYIITVPTPVDKYKKPDLTPIMRASETVGRILKPGDIVIFESTVFPGCTEEICVPILEKESGLEFNKDFYCGYSPERINPGDKVHTVTTIKKVTSGSTPEIADRIDDLYSSIITAGTFKASSIKVAEAAKVIENAQRDINIAFVNELSKIFNRMNIDTTEVLNAAGTKWNFLNFKPGLVGGHCIGVDPYYLTYKAESLGYRPEIILAGRRINDSMGKFVVREVLKGLSTTGSLNNDIKVLVMGVTFKENCPDVRNTRVVDIVEEFTDYAIDVDVYDPMASKEEVKDEYNLELVDNPDFDEYQALILAVPHEQFMKMDWKELSKNAKVVYDVKSVLPQEFVTSRL